ncbi:MAG: AMP-binding protein [Rubrivivax sp.]|nr:AMP-binding protein [Rubrivivax sp.]
MITPTLTRLFLDLANTRGHDAAIVYEGGSLSHAAFQAGVERQAAALAAAGVKAGDRVVVFAGNRPEVLVLLGACAWLGAMMVPLNLRLSAAELAQQTSDAVPRCVIVDAQIQGLFPPDIGASLPVLVLPAAPSGELALAGTADGAARAARADTSDAALLMIYTAAVKGRARGAVLSQDNVVAACSQLGQSWQLGPSDRWLGVLPLFHVAGISIALAVQAAGGASVLLPRFDPARAVQAIDEQRITVIATFAPMLGAMLDAADATQPAAALTSLRVAFGLESLEVQQRLAARCPGATFWSGYGQTEVSSMACLGPAGERPGSAGRAAAPTELVMLDEAGVPVPAGTLGEIAVRGPTVFLGYWDPQSLQPQPTTTPEGWHRTGDLGKLDADGWLWYAGRAAYKQLIKSGGENVYPAEVESVLMTHPAVRSARVYGEPDPKWGEAVVADCVLEVGAQAGAADLISFVGERLAHYKRPKTIRLVASTEASK